LKKFLISKKVPNKLKWTTKTKRHDRVHLKISSENKICSKLELAKII